MGNLRRLAYFVAAVEAGSFNAAAERLVITKIVVSQQVARLTDPEKIAGLPFIANTALREHLLWNFSRGKTERRAASMQASVFLDATLAVRAAVCAGAGFSVLPDFAIADDLAAGRPIHVLPWWSLPSGDIHAVFPAACFRSAKVCAFVELLSEREQQWGCQESVKT